jgi:predicted protein tyrosine phosphatase
VPAYYGNERAKLEAELRSLEGVSRPHAEAVLAAAQQYAQRQSEQRMAQHQAELRREAWINEQAAALVDQQEIEERAARMKRNRG